MAKQQCVSKVSAKKPVQDKIDQKKKTTDSFENYRSSTIWYKGKGIFSLFLY